MDAFSWFRLKRRGIRPRIDTEITVPLDTEPTIGFVIYFRPDSGETLPDEDRLRGQVLRWVEERLSEPLRTATARFVARDGLDWTVVTRDDLPEPPDDLLRAYNPGEIEERRFRDATHAVIVSATDRLAPPRTGLWAAQAAAAALAAALPSAAVVDPLFPRLLTRESLVAAFPPDGHVRPVEHILIPYSLDRETGLAWITTRGMGRLGLPELEIRDVPPNLVPALMPVVNGLASRLAEDAMAWVDRFAHRRRRAPSDEGDDAVSLSPEQMLYPAQFLFTAHDVRQAYADSDGALGGGDDGSDAGSGAYADPEDFRAAAGGATLIRLEVATPRGVAVAPAVGSEDEPVSEAALIRFLRILPPHGARQEPGIWLNRLLSDLFGSEPNLAAVEAGDAAMEAAHQEALRDLPFVRARFQAGFRFGEVLHVKHGFPTEMGDGHEYMWIVVTGWENGVVTGQIANDPQYRRDLVAGLTVDIPEDEIFDWLIVHPDGRTEGAFTNQALGGNSDGDEEPGDEDGRRSG